MTTEPDAIDRAIQDANGIALSVPVDDVSWGYLFPEGWFGRTCIAFNSRGEVFVRDRDVVVVPVWPVAQPAAGEDA